MDAQAFRNDRRDIAEAGSARTLQKGGSRVNIMSLAIRLLIVIAVFAAATVAAYFIDNSLGIDPEGWQHAVSIGVVVAVTGIAWRNAFPRRPYSS
jgi:peptidoglycan/LPS O-acetylase OafA/YrhL